MTKPIISFVLPVFNEQDTINIFYRELKKVSETITEQYEMIFVDDGSNDLSWQRIKQLAQNDTHVKALRFSRNFGHQIALTAGYDYARGDAIISMDTDLQHPPSVIPLLVQKWKGGAFIVHAQRSNRNVSFVKKIVATLYYKLLDSITTITLMPNVADFRLIDKKVLTIIKQYKGPSRYLRGLVAWTGLKNAYVDFDCNKRYAGTTGYTLKKMLQLAFDGITSFSTVPLRLTLYIGCLMLLFFPSFIIKPSIIENYLFLLLYLGITMLCFQLWFIGLYIRRLYHQQSGLPCYVITESANIEE